MLPHKFYQNEKEKRKQSTSFAGSCVFLDFKLFQLAMLPVRIRTFVGFDNRKLFSLFDGWFWSITMMSGFTVAISAILI